ncbi:outer membrane beta-barrel protein [uncultured Microbulbifer sp.]|uniref:outer membrane beta-barrel protein n=1 Tax=uncultured Microbulbifer sp. TaxID=348147 RepID=UPI0025E9139B|nr:outer membrane beta-barrel protein [uncultured Microbulbifer sp.]
MIMLINPKIHLRKTICIFLSTLCLPVVADPIKLGSGFLLSPAVGVDLRYDDNINNAPEDGVESYLMLISPRLALEYDRGTAIYSLQYSLSHGDYLDTDRDSFTDQELTAGVDWELNQRHSLALGAAYLDINEEFNDQVAEDLDSLIFERDRYRQSGVFVNYDYGAEGARGHLGVTLGTNDRNYIEELTSPDRRTTYGDALFSFGITGKTAFLTQLEARDIRYEEFATPIPNRDNREAALLLGAEHDTEQLTVNLLAGLVRKDFDNPEIGQYQRPRWTGTLAWRPTELSELTLILERRPVESFGTFSNFVDAKSGFLGWQHSWSEKVRTNTSFRYTRADFAGTDLRENIRRLNLTFFYQLRPWIDVRTGISSLEQGANAETLSYERNQVFLGFDAAY